MNNWAKLGIVAAIVGTASMSVHAQSVTLFNNIDTISGGTVVVSGSQVVSIAGATGNLGTSLPASFVSAAGLGSGYATNVYTFNYTVASGAFQILDSGSVEVLGGTLTSSANLVSSPINPSFILYGDGLLTSGTWLDAIRIASAGSANNQLVGATFGFTGLADGRVGADQFYLSASAVPEPSEWAAVGMLGTGLAGLVLRARRRTS